MSDSFEIVRLHGFAFSIQMQFSTKWFLDSFLWNCSNPDSFSNDHAADPAVKGGDDTQWQWTTFMIIPFGLGRAVAGISIYSKPFMVNFPALHQLCGPLVHLCPFAPSSVLGFPDSFVEISDSYMCAFKICFTRVDPAWFNLVLEAWRRESWTECSSSNSITRPSLRMAWAFMFFFVVLRCICHFTFSRDRTFSLVSG